MTCPKVFLKSHQFASSSPSQINPGIISWLLDPHHSWTSEEWNHQEFLETGLAVSTKKGYQAGLNCCIHQNPYLSSDPNFNRESNTVCGLPRHTGTLFSVSTIQSYLAALRHCKALADPSNSNPFFHLPHMAVLLRGIKRYQACRDSRVTRLPITASIMRHIKSALSTNGKAHQNCTLWAAFCVGFLDFSGAANTLHQTESTMITNNISQCQTLPSISHHHVGQYHSGSNFLRLTNQGKATQSFWALLTQIYVLLQ